MANWKKTFISAFTAQILAVLGISFAIPFLPFFVAELGIEDTGDQAFWAGSALAASGLAFALFAPIWGTLADKYSRKLMVCRAMFAATVVLVLMSFVQNVGQLVVCRLLHGAFTGTISASVALVASVTPQKRSGFALGMMQTAVFIGHAIGPFFGGFVADTFGYRTGFRMGAMLCLTGGALLYFFAEEKPDNDKKEENTSAPPPGFRQILMVKGFALAVLVMFGVRLCNTMVNPSFPLIIRDILPDTLNINSIAGSVMAITALTGAASAAILGHMGDRLGQRTVLVGCCLGACAASMGHFFASTIFELALARVLFGLAVAGMLPSANAMIHSMINPGSLGKAYGLATSLSMLGSAVGPFAGGYIARMAGLRIPFLVTAVAQLALAAAIAMAFAGRKRNR